MIPPYTCRRYPLPVTHPRRYVAGLALLAVALLATGCGGLTRPQGWASPAFNDSTAFVFLDKDRLSALDISGDGPATLKWEFPAEGATSTEDIDIEAAYGRPTIDGDRLYFSGHEGSVYAVNLESGLPAWQYDDVTGNITDGPTLAEGTLAFGTSEGRLYLLDAESGRPSAGWEGGKTVGEPVWAAPVVLHGVVYVATMKGTVIAYSIEGGAEVWEEPFEADGAIASLTLVGDDTLFAPSFDKHVYLLDVATGEARFPEAFATTHWVWTTPAVEENIAYFGDLDGKIYALDITTNEMQWAAPYDAGDKVKSGPLVSGDTLVVVDHAPIAHFLSLDDGTAMGTFALPEASTVRADLAEEGDEIYAITTKGEFFRIDVETRTASEITVVGAQ